MVIQSKFELQIAPHLVSLLSLPFICSLFLVSLPVSLWLGVILLIVLLFIDLPLLLYAPEELESLTLVEMEVEEVEV